MAPILSLSLSIFPPADAGGREPHVVVHDPDVVVSGGHGLGPAGQLIHLGNFASQDFESVSALFVEVLRRIAETVSFPCKMTDWYCGDLRTQRIRAKTTQTNLKILAREIPYPPPSGRSSATSCPGAGAPPGTGAWQPAPEVL